jgi:orotidine-5'-phosphate decarboxylase
VSEHFADRLLRAIESKGSPVCVGIDPVYERLPDEFRSGGDDQQRRIDAIGRFSREVLRIVSPLVPAVKVQSAYFEVYRGPGVALYFDIVRAAAEAGLLVIGDVKRNDIGSTARAYAAGHLTGAATPDAITINGYLGADGLEPFVEAAREEGKGVFVLVRTSNPSAKSVQDFPDASGKKLYEHIAEQVAVIGGRKDLIGTRGYSCIGAVVGATYPDEGRRLRELMPQQIFLVPGYGAQGATAADCAAAFKGDGTGAIVNASRSVIFAHQREEYADMDWKQAVEQAAKTFANDIAKATMG